MRKFFLSLSLTILMSASLQAGKAGHLYQNPYAGGPRSGATVLSLLTSMAKRPELLDAAYLRRILGAEDRTFVQNGAAVKHYSHYVEPGTSYDFAESTIMARTVSGGDIEPALHRQLVCHMSNSGLTHGQVRQILGQPERRYFDNGAHPVEVYRLSPHASVSITEPANSFNVSTVEINYIGAALSKPTASDLALADQYRLDKAKNLLAAGVTNTAVALLAQHLEDRPNDFNGHLIYASILKRLGDVNGSLEHYRLALDLSRGAADAAAQDRAIKGLAQFGVVKTVDSLDNNLGANSRLAGNQSISASQRVY